MNVINCTTSRRNTPWKSFCDVNLSAYRKIIVAPVGHSFATATAASLQASWLAEVMKTASTRVLPLKPAYNVKPENQDDTFADTAFEGKKFIRNGKEGFTLEIEANPYVMERLWTINRVACSLYIIDVNENILGWSSDGTKFNAFSVELLHVKKMTQSDGSTPRTIEISVVLSNPNEWNGSPQVAVPETGFSPSEMDGLYDIAVTPTAGKINTTSALYVTATIVGTGKPFTGATNTTATPPKTKDFVVSVASTGVDVAVTSITEESDGNYKLAGTFLSATPYNVYTASPWLAAPTSVIVTVLPCESYVEECTTITV